MTDFTSVSIRPPRDWQAFERHSRLLFEYALRDPTTQNNARPGQRQHGVDIFGRRGGGTGPLVGIQCKGKDSDYGGIVTEAELLREVKNTQKFQPDIKEFILITTAPDDADIQEKARLLEQGVRAAGRDLSISVWGWGRVQQEINRYGEVLRAFHPDATPFTDVQLDAAAQARKDSAQIKEILTGQEASRKASEERMFELLEARLPRTQIGSSDPPAAYDPVDKVLNDQIDSLRDLIRERPKTALALLNKLKEKSWVTASNKIRFRILGNLGSAHYTLGEYEQAAELLVEAYPYDPGTAVSFANKIAGLLIKGQEAEARQLAKEAVARFPDSVDLALQRLQAREESEDVERLWSELPQQMQDRSELLLFRITALRLDGDPQWRKLAELAKPAPPVEEKLKVMRAEAVIERVLSGDRSALGIETGDVPEQAEIENAASTLDEVWQQSLKKETPRYLGAAHNGALAYNILGRRDDACRLLDEALELPEAGDETKRLRLALYNRHESLGDAIRLADTLSDTPRNAITRAELRVRQAPSEARTLLERRDTYTDHLDVIGAAFVVVDSYLSEENFDAAMAESERLKKRFPDDVQSYLTIYRVKKASATSDAQSYLDEAVSKIVDGTDFVSRFMVADELAQAMRWNDVVRLLRPYVSRHFDSQSLRALIAAAANGDRREVLKSILDELPAEVAKRPFYRRSRIALAIRLQDIRAAETEIREYLAESTRNLEMHLQLMHALFRQDKFTELRAEAAKPASGFDGEPLDFLQLAQFKDSFGDWQEAHAVAYQTLLRNFEDAEVNMAYVAVFLRPGHSTGLEVEPATVAENMAVTLTVDSEPAKLFIVEPDPSLRLSAQYIPASHPIAREILGRAKGERVRLPDDVEATITWVKPKVLHALHEVMENFQRLFPESDGLERVTIDTSAATTSCDRRRIRKVRKRACSNRLYSKEPQPRNR
jgi:tetratricopeptide (TPR) repeat protein